MRVRLAMFHRVGFDGILTGLGLITAVILGSVFHMDGGSLHVFGTAISDSFSFNRMISALLSVTGPVFVLLPFYVVFRANHFKSALLRAGLAPWLLFFPSLTVWMVKAGTFSFLSGLVLLHLSLLLICLSAWVFMMKQALDKGSKSYMVFLIWAILWTVSDLLSHVHHYVVPYLDGRAFKVLDMFYWCLPPVSSLNSMVANLLSSGGFSFNDQGWLLLQVVVLLGLRVFIAWRNDSKISSEMAGDS